MLDDRGSSSITNAYFHGRSMFFCFFVLFIFVFVVVVFCIALLNSTGEQQMRLKCIRLMTVIIFTKDQQSRGQKRGFITVCSCFRKQKSTTPAVLSAIYILFYWV